MSSVKKEFYNIYNEFYQLDKFKDLNYDIHHGLPRLKHIERVAKYSFYVTKFFGLDYISATRGAFLHDFFTDDEVNRSKWKDYLNEHPKVALRNAKKYFKVNDVEKDVISCHMYPISKNTPKYRETLVVSICDKVASIYEFFRYQLKMSVAVLTLFVFNIMR